MPTEAEQIKILQEENARLKTELAAEKQLTKSLQDEITEQEKQVTAPAAQATTTTLLPEKPVELDGKKYKFIYPKFKYKGTEYTAAQASKDEELLKQLIAIQFGGLVEIL